MSNLNFDDAQKLCRLLTGNDKDQKEWALEQIEQSTPVSEQAWKYLDDFCTSAKMHILAEVVLNRFLKIEPLCLSARFAKMRLFSRIRLSSPGANWKRQEEIINEINNIREIHKLGIEYLLKTGEILLNIGEKEKALEIFREALLLDKTSARAWRQVVLTTNAIESKKRSKRELNMMLDMVPHSGSNLISILETADKVGEIEVVRSIANEIISVTERPDSGLLITVMDITSRYGMSSIVSDCFSRIDLNSIKHRAHGFKLVESLGRVGLRTLKKEAEERYKNI